jgi:hypothetical protein
MDVSGEPLSCGWVGPKVGLDFCSRDVWASLARVWTRDRVARSESLCRPNYLGSCERPSAVFELAQAATLLTETPTPRIFVLVFRHFLSSVYCMNRSCRYISCDQVDPDMSQISGLQISYSRYMDRSWCILTSSHLLFTSQFNTKLWENIQIWHLLIIQIGCKSDTEK